MDKSATHTSLQPDSSIRETSPINISFLLLTATTSTSTTSTILLSATGLVQNLCYMPLRADTTVLALQKPDHAILLQRWDLPRKEPPKIMKPSAAWLFTPTLLTRSAYVVTASVPVRYSIPRRPWGFGWRWFLAWPRVRVVITMLCK
jgi:hypothetical protein